MRNEPRWLPAAVAAAAAAAFLPALGNGFVRLDANDALILDAASGGARFWSPAWIFSSSFFLGNYEPLHWLVLAFVHAAAGMNPAAYHLAGLAAHAAASAALYWTLAELGFDAACAAAGALFFAVHPLRVEAVAWVMGQHYAEAGFFFLVSIASYLRGRRRLSLGSFAASLLFLPAGLALPFILLVLDRFVLHRWNPREKLPYFALSGAAAAAGVAARAASHNLMGLAGLGAAQRALLAGHAALFYPAKTLLPENLSPAYALPYPVDASAWLPGALAAAGLTAFLVRSRRERPGALALWLVYLLCLLPVSGLATSGTQAAADRYSYFPAFAVSAGVAAALRLFLAGAGRRQRLAAAAASALILAGLSTLSWSQCRVWRDTASVWNQVLAVDPESGVGRVGLGDILLGEGRTEEAAAEFEKAISLDPRLVAPEYGLGYIAARRGRSAESIERFQRALQKDQSFAPAWAALGAELAKMGKVAASIPYFERAVQLRPEHDRARFNLALALTEVGRRDEAAAQYRRALALNPEFAEARVNLDALMKAAR